MNASGNTALGTSCANLRPGYRRYLHIPSTNRNDYVEGSEDASVPHTLPPSFLFSVVRESFVNIPTKLHL